MLSRFHKIPERDGQTERQAEVLYQIISIARQCTDAREICQPDMFSSARVCKVDLAL